MYILFTFNQRLLLTDSTPPISSISFHICFKIGFYRLIIIDLKVVISDVWFGCRYTKYSKNAVLHVHDRHYPQ